MDDHKRLFYNYFSIRYDEQTEPESEEEEVEYENKKDNDDKTKKDDDDKMKKDDDDKMRGKKSGQTNQTPFFVFVLIASALVILLA